MSDVALELAQVQPDLSELQIMVVRLKIASCKENRNNSVRGAGKRILNAGVERTPPFAKEPKLDP